MKLAIVCISLMAFASYANGLRLFKCKSKHTEFEQVTISPAFVSIFGNVPITIEGPWLKRAVSAEIRLHDKTVQTLTGSITTDNKVSCLLPFLYKNGRIQVDLLVTLLDNSIETYIGFIYTQKHVSAIQFEFTSQTTIELTWETGRFDVGSLLDLELFEIVGEIFTSRGFIKRSIPNTGSFIGELDQLALNLIERITNIFVVELKSNSESSRNTAPKQHPMITDYLNSLRGKSEQQLNLLCRGWYMQDKGVANDTLCCPPTLKQAQRDEEFEPVDDLKIYNPDADHGFIQRVPSPSGASQRCVYKNGVLLVGPPSGGTVRSVSPKGKRGELPHIVPDILPWYTCCKLSVTKSYCDLYYEKRPSNDGKCYKDPGCGCAVGDPHFTTFDGFYYTFLGLGEFWIINSPYFSMQGRFTQFQNTKATVCTVYVMHQRSSEGEATIQLSLKEKHIEIMIDSQVVAMHPTEKQPKRTIMYNGVSITIFSPQDIRIAFSSGFAFKFTYDPYVINMAAVVSEKAKGTFRGLFGVFDDNQDNELTYPNGRVIPTSSDMSAIHDYGMHWKVVCDDSHFTYPPGKDYDSFQDDDFVPHLDAPDLDKLSPEDVAACKGSYECLYDLSITGNVEMATGTLTAVEDFVETSKSSNRCDRITVPRNGFLQVINYLEGSTVRLVCNLNFKLEGLESVRCIKDLLGVLSWNGRLGGCVKLNKCANENAWLQWLCENGYSQAAEMS